MAQICTALMPTLLGVQKLVLEFYRWVMPIEWQNDEIVDGTTWHDLLRSFIGLNKLRIYGSLSQELSRALQVDEIGLNPSFLPDLQEIQFDAGSDENMFDSFLRARQVSGFSVRPVRSTSR